ncbi:MAG: hypothetical protein PHD76_00940 [Methylacidiphilales bacterium]|nr:hypothetical protein [Candidatus Methylacidiphilales bacterium]
MSRLTLVKRILFIAIPVLLFCVCLSAAQAKPFWRVDLPGGSYVVALDSITSVSTHEYLVDGTIRVKELTVDTTGNTTARFYYLAPVDVHAPGGIGESIKGDIQQHFSDLMDKTGQGNLQTTVIKNYPTTTHAKTVEYRLISEEQVLSLFKSVESAWRNYKETTYKPDAPK